MREFWNKIKPFDYNKNPIGSLKVEIMFALVLINIFTIYVGSDWQH